MLDATQRQSVLVILIVSLLLLQLLYISQNLDAYALIMNGAADVWQRAFAHLGSVAKVSVLFTFVLSLLLHQRVSRYWHFLLNQASIFRALFWLLPQIVSFAFLLWFSYMVFDRQDARFELDSIIYLLWILFAMATFVSTLRMLAPFSDWLRLVMSEYKSGVLALSVSMIVWMLASFTKGFWGPLSDWTFIVSASLLRLSNNENIYVNIDEKHLGIGDFIVNIAPACSGYEGIGLVCAFTAIYLYVYRSEFRFPRSLVLFPIGAMCIWLLNSVRICVLIMIGHAWSPEVAVGGFHSQAGWLTFIVTSMSLLWLARSSAYFTLPLGQSGRNRPIRHTDDSGANRAATSVGKATTIQFSAIELEERHHAAGVREQDKVLETVSESVGQLDVNLPMATLIPLVSLLTAVLVGSALSAEFDWMYPSRVIVVGVVLYFVWPTLKVVLSKPSLEAVLAGVLVAGMWVAMHANDPESDRVFQSTLEGMPFLLVIVWMIFRAIGTSAAVPIAEELAFRSYILCKLSKSPVITTGRMPVSVLAIIVSSLAFGALHGAWVAGTLAGLVYAVVRLRSHTIMDAVYAHGITNALLFGYAAYAGVWSLL